MHIGLYGPYVPRVTRPGPGPSPGPSQSRIQGRNIRFTGGDREIVKNGSKNGRKVLVFPYSRGSEKNPPKIVFSIDFRPADDLATRDRPSETARDPSGTGPEIKGHQFSCPDTSGPELSPSGGRTRLRLLVPSSTSSLGYGHSDSCESLATRSARCSPTDTRSVSARRPEGRKS